MSAETALRMPARDPVPADATADVAYAHRPEAAAPDEAAEALAHEAALVSAARSGDRLSFRALYEMASPAALRLATRLLGSTERAEEVVQEAFCQAWAGLRRFRGQARFRTWVLTIVRNAALDTLRRDKTRRKVSVSALSDLPGASPGPHEPLVAGELRAALDAALDALPEETRTAFVLAALERLSYAEVASVMKTSVDGVKCRVYRAREHLRCSLSPFLEE